MAKRGYVSTINAMARAQARWDREKAAEQKRQERARIQQERAALLSKALLDKNNKLRYLEARSEETADKNTTVDSQIEEIQQILEHTLSVDDTITFDSLHIHEEYTPLTIPQELMNPWPPPNKQQYISRVKAPGFLENALGLKNRYKREQQAAQAEYEADLKTFEELEKERKGKLDQLLAQDNAAKQKFNHNVQQRNKEVDDLEKDYQGGDISAVITYNSMVLERSNYPETFPQTFRLAYAPDSKELVIEYELPEVSLIPSVAEYRYIKAKDVIEEKPRKPAEIKEIYQDLVASITIRTIHEVFEADQCHHIDLVVFNGFVKAVDPATGKDIRPCLISLRTTREKFLEINLARINKAACLRNLGAQVSPQPQALQPVKPVIEFDMVDKRFVEQVDVLSDLESRPNLLDLTPTEFEALVSNLFGKMGLETKLTRSSRDGGVDAVAFDTRPILGGKVVIQAKRYKDTVGVSAVRDLYGTMLNEGASKGIIVTTSKYGPDAYNFANDKPLELIDGGGLLYLLDQVGIKARIVFPEDSN